MKINRWEKFKDFFQITIFRYLVVWFSVVPVLAAAFQSLPNELVFSASHTSFPVHLVLPFNWQLLWLSSVFFLIAWIIYLLRCPSFVKQYNTYSDFKNVGHDQRWLVWEAQSLLHFEIFDCFRVKLRDKFVQRLITKKYLDIVPEAALPESDLLTEPLVQERQTCIYFDHQNTWYRFAMPIIQNDKQKLSAEREVFWEIFGRYSGSRFLSRLFITIFLGLSGILFVVVLMQHIVEGFKYVIDWVLTI